MKLSDFILLDAAQKNKVLMHEAVLVAKQKEDSGKIRFLFQMDVFYVEMCCQKGNKQACEYNSFVAPEHLQAYLEGISLNGLL